MSEEYIRPTVRAVIRKGELVLVQVKKGAKGQQYLTLPGGRQEHGETMQECLGRECLEEIGIAPGIGELLHVADVFRQRSGKPRHLVEMLFACTVPDTYVAAMGCKPDKRQIATKWVDLSRDGALFRPRYDQALTRKDRLIYLGRLVHGTP
ncbi:NUDIX domain-containing protein [Paracoccus sp. Z330]|uniref:NUDIX domain-containing protein n=1 Tax=Paracoccus onchidii TaxID=3017813 RepID=A0ABT4Z9F8_9RHOB|nr:NUDIX domain-containing protein [Paracoccus onchidii]MDB6175991.1 NUDIX domain-containing protein [Paracoccus onchidii]